VKTKEKVIERAKELCRKLVLSQRQAFITTYRDEKDEEGKTARVEFNANSFTFPKVDILIPKDPHYNNVLKTKKIDLNINESFNHKIRATVYLPESLSPMINTKGNIRIFLDLEEVVYINEREGIRNANITFASKSPC